MRNYLFKIGLTILILILIITAFLISATVINASDNDVLMENNISETDSNLNSDLNQIEQEFEKQEEAYNKNDLLALAIARKYKLTEAENLIRERQQDCELMIKMCEMINEGKLNADEETVFKMYLERRLSWLYDDVESSFDGEDELECQIENILGYEHWNKE